VIPNDEERPPLGFVKFMVNDRPRCVWELGLDERQLESIEAMDPDFFLFQIRTLRGELDGDDRFRAACAIRAVYWHCMETFFALLFATLQAPRATYAWLLDYRPGDLPKLIACVNASQRFPTAFQFESISWASIASLLIPSDESDAVRMREIQLAFARAWSYLSEEAASEVCRAEYNTIKHGFRLRSRGFTLTIGDPPIVSGGSEYGSQFFSRESIGDSRLHFRGRRQLENWLPNATIEKVRIMVSSLHNIKGFLLHIQDALPTGYQFHIPDTDTDLDRAWSDSPKVLRANFDREILPAMIDNFSSNDIRKVFEESQQESRTT
jgi:hypothetical protein